MLFNKVNAQNHPGLPAQQSFTMVIYGNQARIPSKTCLSLRSRKCIDRVIRRDSNCAAAIEPARSSTFWDAEHVVILMQENRSFDHAFGALRGSRLQ